MRTDADAEIFVSCEWLKDHLDHEKVVIVDCRYNLFEHDLGLRQYREGHIPGAFFMDMEKDLAGSVEIHGGRHPVPDEQDFIRSISRAGIRDDSIVVAYDNDGSGAARLWWLLSFLGQRGARILNGGFPLWKEMSFPLSTEVPEERASSFAPRKNPELIVHRNGWLASHNMPVVIDSRARERYSGEIEPIDSKAGHIPGAINIPYTEVLKRPGLFKSREEIESIFRETGEDPVVYCGSGVTSCVNYVALRYIGKHPRLYAGSWSDWISFDDSEVATGYAP